MNRTVFSH